jgi:hypothetical protein
MRPILLLGFIATILFSSCEDDMDTTACVHTAIVNRQSPTQCEIVLDLENGSSIIPTFFIGFCGTGIDFTYYDSLYQEMRHGRKVRIGYEIQPDRDCEGIPVAYIHCMEVIKATDRPVD